MDLGQHVDKLLHDVAIAAEVGGDEALAVAERLTRPLDSAIRLMLLDALSAAADEITRELAPGSVELRLRGGEPEFVVPAAPVEAVESRDTEPEAPLPPEGDDGAMARINLRLPEQLKASVEQAAARERLSVNAWLVRAVAAAVAPDPRDRPSRQRGGRVGQRYTGWVH